MRRNMRSLNEQPTIVRSEEWAAYNGDRLADAEEPDFVLEMYSRNGVWEASPDFYVGSFAGFDSFLGQRVCIDSETSVAALLKEILLRQNGIVIVDEND